MGWSEFTAKPEVDKIFKKLKLKYTMRRILEPGSPIVQILHEGEIDIPSIKSILNLFPDFIYVEFVPNTPFAETNEGDTFEVK